MTVAAGRARVTSWATIMALSIVGAAPPAPATDCAAFAEQLTPHCPAARSLLLDDRQRLGFVGLWVAGADSSQQINDWTVAAASDEPSTSSRDALIGFQGLGCAARHFAEMPLTLLTRGISAALQRWLCARGILIVSLDAMGLDFQARFAGKFRGGSNRRRDGWATCYKYVLWRLGCFFDRLLYLDGDAVLIGDPRPFVEQYAAADFVACSRERKHRAQGGHHTFAGMNTHVMLLRPNESVFADLLAKTDALDFNAFTNTEQDVIESYFCQARRRGACSARVPPFRYTFGGDPARVAVTDTFDLLPHAHHGVFWSVNGSSKSSARDFTARHRTGQVFLRNCGP